MKTNTTIEKLGRKNWKSFEEYFSNLWQFYKEHGKSVLELNLGDSYNIYKDAFLNSNFDYSIFIASIRKIWENLYHHVANTYSELIMFYEMSQEKGYEFNPLLPETGDYRFTGEIEGKDQPFSVSKELYDNTVRNLINDNFMCISTANNEVYKLTLQKKFMMFKTFFEIIINKV